MTWGPRVHFIGIGGAGMSAIAKVLVERGVAVSGSDLKGSRITTALERMGADIRIGHDAANVEGAAQVVFSAAIADSNRELVRAREMGLEIVTRGAALARLLEGTRSVVVAGTHGKTTTTSMIVSILQSAGRDPTYLVGGGLNDAGTNARSGADDLIVAESDESDGSFLLLAPTIAVITNVELDHVDHWSSMGELRDAFERFVASVAPDGTLVVPHGDPLADGASGRTLIAFGSGGDISAQEITSTGDGTLFALVERDARAEVTLHVPGHHNIVNALAAAGAARAVGVELDEVAAGLSGFNGVERRFEVKGVSGGVTVVDDYAHHPTEVRATLAAAGEGDWRRVVAVFQPHRYTRTRALSREFGTSFETADRVVVTEIYGAGEPAIPGVTGKLIADAVAEQNPGRPVAYFPHRSDLTTYLVTSARPGDLVLTLGAGDITSLGAELLDRLGERA
jgi:UDP-N-acetylmuramate--alanine ligase